MTNDGWGRYETLVLEDLRRLRVGQDENRTRVESRMDQMFAALSDLKTDIALLKLKAGAWGAIAGGVAILFTALSRKILGI